MSIFNFFSRKKQNDNIIDADSQDINDQLMPNMVNADLFVDNQPPIPDTAIKPNPLEKFLSQNFEWNGCNDGYEFPDSEYLNSKLKLIRAEFRTAIDKSIDLRRFEVGELKLHLIQISGISERLEAQIIERIRQNEEIVHVLDTEKILSIENEGIVSSAIQSYRIGFIKGVERFQQEKLYIGNTGLYN